MLHKGCHTGIHDPETGMDKAKIRISARALIRAVEKKGRIIKECSAV
jgi:hypothetical protein